MKTLLLSILSAGFISCFAQSFTSIGLKAGAGIGYQSKSPKLTNDANSPVIAYAVGVEPALYRFGSEKQFEITADLLYLQKGGSNTSKTFSYDQYGNVNGYGTMSLPTLLRYYSVAPCFKFRLSDLLYAKAGPRLDLYSSSLFKDIPPGLQSPEPYYTFEAVNYGISYALCISAGKGKIRFLAELMGQNDFGSSSYNNSTSQSYSNNAYYLNIGVLLCLKN